MNPEISECLLEPWVLCPSCDKCWQAVKDIFSSVHITGRGKSRASSGWDDVHAGGVLYSAWGCRWAWAERAYPNSCSGPTLPVCPAYPLIDRLTQGKFIGEMDAVEIMLFPSCMFSAGICFGCNLCSAAVLGLSTEPHRKECASFRQTMVYPWEKGRRNIACDLQKFLLLFLASLTSPGKQLAAFEWKTTKHLRTTDQSWQHRCTPCSAEVGVLLNHWVGIKLKACWGRRLTQSILGKLCLHKKKCLKKLKQKAPNL